MASFYVQNFGCRATQADGAALERQFEDRGLERASAPQTAEIVVLNTCTVTASADQDARAAIRRIHRQNPACQIVVTGCYAQRAPAEIAALPGVTQVVGNSHKHRLAEIGLRAPDLRPRTSDLSLQSHVLSESSHDSSRSFVPLTQLLPNPSELESDVRGLRSDERGPKSDARVFVSDIFAHTELLAAPVFDAANERTRPNLKVQDGCDNRCSFCVIPFVRGQSRSLPLADVIREANHLVAAGYHELVISGINLGRWGRDLKPGAGLQASGVWWTQGNDRRMIGNAIPTTNDERPTTLLHLIRAILCETFLEKLRISSVEPMDWSDSLIRLVAESPRIAKHAHVPLQSGSDRILRLMHRKYRPWHYREKILKIREAMPAAAIGADVMVGFPGETDADFEATRRLIEELPFTYLHVFTYSARPGTPAAGMPNQVPVRIARDRSSILRELAAAKKQAFLQSFLGKTVEAITLKKCGTDTPVRDPSDFTEALTDNYLKLYLKGHHPPNQWIAAQVAKVHEDALFGQHALGS